GISINKFNIGVSRRHYTRRSALLPRGGMKLACAFSLPVFWLKLSVVAPNQGRERLRAGPLQETRPLPPAALIRFSNPNIGDPTMINRRSFLSTASQSVIGAVALTALNRIEGEAATAKLGSIGVQLYTVRGEMEKDFEGSLEKIAAIGYKEVKFAGYYNKSPNEIKAILDRHGLTAPSTHAPLTDIQTKLDQTIETAKAIGHRYLICPYLVDKDRGTLDDYKRHAETFNRAGQACQK